MTDSITLLPSNQIWDGELISDLTVGSIIKFLVPSNKNMQIHILDVQRILSIANKFWIVDKFGLKYIIFLNVRK